MKSALTLVVLIVTSAFSSPAFSAITEKPAQVTVQRIELRVSDSKTVEATLELPAHLRRGQKLPLFLIFGGFENAARVLSLVHPNRPVALASFDYPFTGSRRLRLRDAPALLKQAKNLFPETITGIENLVSILSGDPQIDQNQIIAVGASFGAPFVLAAAARDPKITKVAIVDGFGQPPATMEHVILRSWLPKYGRASVPFAWVISRLVWAYFGFETPEADAEHLFKTQNALMITAEEDSFIPRSSSDSLWSALESSKAKRTRILMPGDHLMPGSDHLISEIMLKIENWLDQSGV